MQYKVLIVDDSKLARMVMASALRRIRPDWALVETTNAAEALTAVSGGAVDIALIDFNMRSRIAGILTLLSSNVRAPAMCACSDTV